MQWLLILLVKSITCEGSGDSTPQTRSIKIESNEQCDDLSELVPNLQWLNCSNGYHHGSKCHMKCSRHYTIEHGTTAHCDASGQWRGDSDQQQQLPGCRRTRCETIKARLEVEEWSCTAIIRNSGDEYLVYGKKRVYCSSESGQEPEWNAVLPICRARETFTMKKSIQNIASFVGDHFANYSKLNKLNRTLSWIDRRFTAALDGRTPCKVFLYSKNKMFRGAQIQISRTRWKRALIKKSNEAAVSPENAKKMFDLLNETVDRFFKPCAKYEKYQRKLVNAYNYILQAIVRA